MTKRVQLIFRRVAPVLSAGLLIQAGGCSVDTSSLAGGLLASIANSLVSNFVFGAFNLI